MSSAPSTSGKQAGTLLRKLHSGFEKRRSLLGGAAREKLDAHLLKVLREVGELNDIPIQEQTGHAPPKSVGTAMTAALWSHPHLTIFFGTPRRAAAGMPNPGPTPEPDFPIVFEAPHIRDALALEDWLLEELREEVDRRVGVMLKQERALDWLWQYFNVDADSGEALFHVLFPGAANVTLRGICRRGAQLYVIVDQVPAPPRSTLFIVWPDPRSGAALEQLGRFGGRYVDPALRRAIARGIGALDDEVIELLDRMVAVVPKKRVKAFMDHDTWRVRGFAGVTGLGRAYAEAASLTMPLRPDAVDLSKLFVKQGKALKVIDANPSFDRLALPRVTAVMRLIYAEMVAGLLDPHNPTDSPIDPRLADLEIYDVGGQLRRALRPLVEWAADAEAAARVARELGVPKAAAEAALAEVLTAWKAQMERGWCAPPAPSQPRSVASICIVHLIQVHRTLRRLMLRAADSRWDHRDLLLLFAGFYFQEAEVQQLWASGLSQVGAPIEETFAVWVWGAWQRLLESLDQDSETFSGAFTFEDM